MELSNPYLSGIEIPTSKADKYSYQEEANINSYLDFLGKAEGADYNTIVGGSTFDDYSKHPGVVGMTTKEGKSTAAGRYQITKSTYDQYAKKLGVTDFSPSTQDAIVKEILKDNDALEDVKKGNYQAANAKLGKVWASLPSSSYKQPKRSNTWVEENLDTAPSKNPYLEGVLDEKPTDTSSADQKGLARPSPSEIASNPYLHDVFPGTKSDISPARSFAKSAGGSATRALISAPAMVYGGKLGYNIGRLGGPYAGIAGAVGGGIGGFVLGEKGIDKAFEYVPDNVKEVLGYDPQTRTKEIEANPESSWHGNLSGNLVLFRPGALKDIILEGGKRISPTVQRMIMGGAGAGIEAGSEKLNNEELNYQHILESGAFTAFAAKPTKYLEKVEKVVGEKLPTFDRTLNSWAQSRKVDPGSKEWTNQWRVPDATEEGVPITIGKVLDADGNQALQKDGKPIIARHFRNEDGSSKEIVMDLDEALARWEEKPWVKAGLPEDAFKSPMEYAQFILKHEQEHTRLPFEEWKQIQDPQGDLFANDKSGVYSEEQLRKDYEHYINRQAFHSVKEDPFFSQPDVLVPKVPKNAAENEKWLADALYSLDKSGERDMVIARARHEAATAEGVTTEMRQRWRAYAEGIGELDPRELELYKKYAADELAERKRLIKYAQQKGWTFPTELEAAHGENVPRILIAKQEGRWKQILDAFNKGEFGGMNVNIARKPGAVLGRTVFAGELPNGNRIVLQQTADGSVVAWRDGKVIPFAKMSEVGSFRPGEKVKNAIIKEANQFEIEKNTPFMYEKDFQGVAYQRLTELRNFVRANQFLEDIKASDWFKENAIKPEGKSVPEGYTRPAHLDRLPQFDGYAFKDDIAHIIEDFARLHSPNWVTYLSGALIKNMMLNPLPHMLNEGWHLFNARGLTGWVTPAGIYRFAKTGMPALKSVLLQDKAYRETLELGGSLLSARVRNSAFAEEMFAKANKEFSQTPEFQSLAKRIGMKPLQLYDAISRKANIAMWTVRDMMYMQLLNETMQYKNMTRAEAIKDVERHMPNYRIPHKVMGFRALSQVLQDPRVTVFSRYHYGLVNSLSNTVADIAAIRHGQAGVRQFLHGMDTAAAIAVAIAVLYPLQDMVAQWLSGNEDATVRRAGPYHIFHALHGMATLEKDPMAVVASFFTFNPALLAGAQLIFDRKLYNGQPIYNPEDSAEKIWSDITDYSLGQWPLVGQGMKAMKEEDEGFKNWLLRQLDIESPTMETVMKREKMVGRKEKAGTRRTMKWEAQRETPIRDAVEVILKGDEE